MKTFENQAYYTPLKILVITTEFENSKIEFSLLFTDSRKTNI